MWARGLIRTQSGVKLRLYVKCREGEEVCGKRDCLSPCHFFFFSFSFCNHAFLVLGTKSLM